jgi:STE24 endopeptidase
VPEPALRWSPRVVCAVLAVALVFVIAVTTPWHLIDLPAPDPTLDFTSAEIARQHAFRHEILRWTTTSWAITAAVPLLIGFTPLGARLYDAVRIRPWFVRVAVLVAGIALIGELLTVPTDVLAERVSRRYGLSVTPWGLWIRDRALNWLLTSLGIAAIVILLMALAKRWRRGWWLPGALATALLVLGVSFAYPVLVEPRFNHFTPMPAGALRNDFLKLAAQDGVPVRDVLVADASRRTTALNAYVSGFGSTRRLVVYDTLLKDTPPAQVRLIVAHELGHAAEDDVLHGTLIGVLGAAFAVTLLGLLLGARMRDPRRVALVVAMIAAGSTLASPVQNLVSRKIEARADYHSLKLTDDPRDFVAMQHSLAVTNLDGLYPARWRTFLFATHPSTPERIAMGRAWARDNGSSVPPLVSAPR